MHFLVGLYKKISDWSRHPNAVYYLALISFLDSSIFPISPIFMLVPMVLASKEKAFSLALITTVASILGGIIGYALGFFAFEMLMRPFIEFMGYTELYQSALEWFQQWGFWAVLLACFSPIPYKIFTIGAGVMQLHLGWFILASTIGRALRFFLSAALICWGGTKMESYFRKRFVD